MLIDFLSMIFKIFKSFLSFLFILKYDFNEFQFDDKKAIVAWGSVSYSLFQGGYEFDAPETVFGLINFICY
jgi:hypothetical protein